MKIIILFVIFISQQALALIPVDGLIYGNIKDINQYDPLEGVFSSKNKILEESNNDHLKKLMEYVGLFRQGYELNNSCQFYDSYRYQDQWQEENAKRSIVATLQYVGIDTTLKAIVEYAKKLELSSSEYEKLIYNLVENNCSKNITVYSLKFIKDNFLNYYKNSSGFNLPSLKDNPYFPENIKEMTNSRETIERQFNLTIKNFRAFCSWGSSTDDYRMLAPYLNNPMILSLVLNILLEKKISWDDKDKSIVYAKSEKTQAVACDDYLCRQRDPVSFKQLFPRMVGSNNLKTDLEALYCLHFKDQKYPKNNSNKVINSWIKNQREEDSQFETMQFISLITTVPDLLIASNKYNDLIKSFIFSNDLMFQKWAKNKTNQFVTDLLYEESLQVDLVSMVKTNEIKKGEFQLIFDYTLGELDRVLTEIDKIHSTFDIEIPKSYLRWLRSSIITANNKGRFEEVSAIYSQVEIMISTQLEKKKDLFLIPMWNEKMSSIVATELISQLTSYHGSMFNEFGHEKVKIPLKFRFGPFALKYLRQKFKENYR